MSQRELDEWERRKLQQEQARIAEEKRIQDEINKRQSKLLAFKKWDLANTQRLNDIKAEEFNTRFRRSRMNQLKYALGLTGVSLVVSLFLLDKFITGERIDGKKESG